MESLKVNRDLLDPDFDGYKLSLDSLPIFQINVGGKEMKKEGRRKLIIYYFLLFCNCSAKLNF